MNFGYHRCVPPAALRVGIVAPVQRVDPYRTVDYVGGVVSEQLFQTPFGYVNAGSDIRPIAFAAALVRQGDDRWVGRIRAGLRFSDGTPVQPGDVVASLRRIWSAERGATVRESADRVVFEFASPVADPHPSLATTWCAISKRGEGEIGSGAYTLAEDSSATDIHLVRNPHYGGEQGPAAIAEVQLRCYQPSPDGSHTALLAALEAGEIDFTQVLSRDAAATLTGVRKLYQPGSSTAVLFLNTERFPDVAVRQAIVASIDRYAITRLCYSNPAGFVARGLLPPRMGSFADGVSQRPVDPALFADVGPLRLVPVWGPRPYLAKPQRVANAIAEQLSAAGLETTVEAPGEVDAYFRRIASGDYDALVTGWIADSGDPADFLNSLLHSSNVPEPPDRNPTAANMARWRDPDADALIAAIRSSGDPERMRELIRLTGERAPFLALMYGPSVTVLNRRVHAFEPHPLNIYPTFAELELED